MITLYGFGPSFGLPEISPYVTKTEVQLKMAGLDYRKEVGRPDRSPKGQLPFIEDEGELVSDSTFIRAHLEATYGVDLDAGLDAAGRATAWTVERMIENHLGWCMIHSRWVLKANFEKGPAHFFDGAPEAVREGLRQDFRHFRADRVLAAVFLDERYPERPGILRARWRKLSWTPSATKTDRSSA